MNEQQQAAMRQALDWFTCYLDKSMSRNNAEALADEAATALRRALEQQPADEPVAVVSSVVGTGDKAVRIKWLGGFPQIGMRLYTRPQPAAQWVGLTDAEFSDCLVEGDPCEALAEPEAWEVMRSVAAKLREKNGGKA